MRLSGRLKYGLKYQDVMARAAVLSAEVPGASMSPFKLGLVEAPPHAAKYAARVLHALWPADIVQPLPWYESAEDYLPTVKGSVEDALEAMRARGDISGRFPALLPLQVEGLNQVLGTGGGHLWWPPGTGKTLAGIVFALAVPGPVVIVAPVSATPVWLREFAARTELGQGRMPPFWWRSASHRKRGQQSFAEYMQQARVSKMRPVIVVGIQNVPDALSDLLTVRPVTIIVDESHMVKSAKRWSVERDDDGAVQFKKKTQADGKQVVAAAMMDLCKQARRKLLLTGTPVPNRPEDLYAQLDLQDAWAWGTSRQWKDRYAGGSLNEFGGYDAKGLTNAEELQDRLAYVVHAVTLEEARAALPPMTREKIIVPAEALCEPAGNWRDDLRIADASSRINALECRIMLNAGRKRNWLTDYIVAALRVGQKVLCFSGRHADVEALFKAVAKQAPKSACVVMTHGAEDTNVPARMKKVDAYMAHDTSCGAGAAFIATGESAGQSLNLQDTDVIIHAMLPYTPQALIQLEGRGARIGQTRPLRVIFPVAENTDDERVLSILLDKLPAVGVITGDSAVASMADTLKTVSDAEDFASRMLAIAGGFDSDLHFADDDDDDE